MSIVPTDEAVQASIVKARASQPDLGALKILALIKEQNPEYTLSQKRLRKLLQTEKSLIPLTGLDPTINVASIAPKVEVKIFPAGKGKGLVAAEKILRGELVFAEEPWISTSDPQLYPLLRDGDMCTTCLSTLGSSVLSKSCPACRTAHFCNRLCQSRAQDSAAHHELLCPAINPASAKLRDYIQANGSRYLDAVSRIIARWMGARGTDEAGRIQSRVWKGMARVNILDKEKERREWAHVGDARTKELQLTHSLLLAALNPTRDDPNYDRFRRLVRRNAELSTAEVERWFGYASFLDLMGLVSLNQESSGGLYALHAHLNHSCEPNLQVRNLPKSFKSDSPPCDLPPPNPAGVRGSNRLSLIARRDIEAGTEFTIPYVDFSLPRDERRQALRLTYGFWCYCDRCRTEA